MHRTLAFLSIGVIAMTSAAFAPAKALTMQECSAKYNAAKAANTLGGKSWNDFRKSECGDTAAAAPAAPSAPPAAGRRESPAQTGNVVFPRAVDTKFASEKPHVQRMKTCSAQWQANKANGGNGDLKWIQKGGGYWPQCNARLKGQTGA